MFSYLDTAQTAAAQQFIAMLNQAHNIPAASAMQAWVAAQQHSGSGSGANMRTVRRWI